MTSTATAAPTSSSPTAPPGSTRAPASAPWQYLRASNKRIGELGLADIDNDGLTDVLYRDPSGGLGYVKSGTAAPLTPLTSVPVPIKDLRFGDFDGDGLTDMFYTRQNQWQVWYGRTRAWTPTQTSGEPISRLLFGEFDGVRGTDVVGILGERLVLLERARRRAGPGSTAGSRARSPTPWRPTSTATARPTSRSATGRRGATAATATRRSSRCETATAGFPTPALNRLPIGRFDGGTRHQVISFSLTAEGTPGNIRYSPGEWLVIWRGLGSGSNFTARSTQTMR